MGSKIFFLGLTHFELTCLRTRKWNCCLFQPLNTGAALVVYFDHECMRWKNYLLHHAYERFLRFMKKNVFKNTTPKCWFTPKHCFNTEIYKKRIFSNFRLIFHLFLQNETKRRGGEELWKGFFDQKKSYKAPIFWSKYTTVKYFKLNMFKLALCVIK